VYMTEFINSFANEYNQTFMTAPFLKTIIFICCNFAYLAIINTISGRPFKNYQFVWLFLIGLWMLAIPFSQNSALKVWLYYLPNQLFLIYLGCYALYQLRIDPLSALAKKYLRFIGWLSIGFGVAILLEDTFVIFNIDQYSDIVFKINNRNVSEDIYTIILSIAIIYFCNRDFTLSVLEKDAAKLEENQSDEPVLLAPFCDAYQLTQREREVLSLLLECKTNQDIANELFLSIGTVKTHIHNIFVKLEVNKRAEVFVSYQLFSQQQTEHLAR
ncbi:helix-turn-helix domain-containing protein, partial [Enterococcus faecalis]|uniref:helix-turn-helix domain-containing protein n=2 Tax=Enterococcus TaxID=1350 RepID=UPI00325AB509